MNLIRDVLDNQIVDRNQQKMGKVDGLVIEIRADQPPRLAYIELGGPALARRLSRRMGRWAAAFSRRWGVMQGQPYRIAWSAVRDVGIDVEVDLEAEATPAMAWEHWLRDHVIRRIPGGG